MTTPSSAFEEPLNPISRLAAAAIAARVFAYISGTETMTLTGAGGIADGVTLGAATATTDQVTIYTGGRPLVTAGGTVTAGGEVMSDAAGKAVDAGGSGRRLGYAETGTTSAGDLVRIRLYPRGVQSLGSGIPAAIPATALTTNGAIPVRPSTSYIITKAGVLADTLAAPTTGTDDGVTLVITSGTANAHTVTATGLYNSGSAAVNLATFAAFAGANMVLQAYLAKWNVISSVGVTFS